MTQGVAHSIAITCTFTAEPVEETLRFWLDELGIAAGVSFAPYNQVFQELLSRTSLMATNRSGANVVLARVSDSLKVALPLRTLFEAPTVQMLAERVEAARSAGPLENAPMIPAVPRTSELPRGSDVFHSKL